MPVEGLVVAQGRARSSSGGRCRRRRGRRRTGGASRPGWIGDEGESTGRQPLAHDARQLPDRRRLERAWPGAACGRIASRSRRRGVSASREWPPRLKKSSVLPTLLDPEERIPRLASCDSSPSRGATWVPLLAGEPGPGSGREAHADPACRWGPRAVSPRGGRRRKAPCSPAPGSRGAAGPALRAAPRPARANDIGDEAPVPGSVLARRHDGGSRDRARAPRRTASISPGSTRKPRSLTWSSTRPRNSRFRRAGSRARSPVRYMRAPGAGGEGSGTKHSAVRPGRLR